MRSDPLAPLPYTHPWDSGFPFPAACTVGEIDEHLVATAASTCPGCAAHAVTSALNDPTVIAYHVTADEHMPIWQVVRQVLASADSPMLVVFERELVRRWPSLAAALTEESEVTV